MQKKKEICKGEDNNMVRDFEIEELKYMIREADDFGSGQITLGTHFLEDVVDLYEENQKLKALVSELTQKEQEREEDVER